MQKLFKSLHHLFIPSDRNNFRARLLHIDFLTGMVAVFALLSIGTQALIGTGVLGLATDITVQKLYEDTNRQRVDHGLSALKYDGKLATAAQKKAEDMFIKNYWAHYSPSGGTPWDFIIASGYSYEFAGENLAHGFMFSDQVVEAWMNSSSHRDNLLKPDYNDVGFAVVNGTLQGEPTTLVVQMFGRALAKEDNEKKTIAVAAAEPASKEAAPFIAAAEPVAGKSISGKTIDLKSINYNSSLLLLILLLVALFIDLAYAYRYRLLRITGKNLAHLIFLVVVLAAVILVTKGLIL